ncbi:MAG TPA: HRDC domain-containing protein [Armatimonadota bacterium]|nr:HRDC domain-containing protein [Armatimonadota bacterium]
MLISQQRKLETLCEQLRAAPPIALDTEFIRERRYFPRLCLVQARAGSGDTAVEALIDPFEVDLKPLLELVADESLVKIVHAGGQDLQIFYQIYGCEAKHVFDTQIAAAFLGYGHQPGYIDLVTRALGATGLSKGSQYTDWAARPLAPEQIDYALADVQYLPALYTTLRADLVARGRLPWAQAEFRRAEARARMTTPPEEIYSRLNTSGLSRRQLGALRELAAARDQIASSIDKPVGYVLPDQVMIQMAKQPPGNPAALRAMRGMPAGVGEYAGELIAALQRAARLPASEMPISTATERIDPRAANVASLMGVITQARALQNGIARTYLATGDQLTALADWWLRRARGGSQELPDIPLMSDWRFELLGKELLELLEGKLAVALKTPPDLSRSNQISIRVLSITPGVADEHSISGAGLETEETHGVE